MAKHGRAFEKAKYGNRPSPPYKASEYCGEEMEGNDGNMYLSKPTKDGSQCRWVRIRD